MCERFGGPTVYAGRRRGARHIDGLPGGARLAPMFRMCVATMTSKNLLTGDRGIV